MVGDGFDRELKIDLKFYPDAELSCRVCGDEYVASLWILKTNSGGGQSASLTAAK